MNLVVIGMLILFTWLLMRRRGRLYLEQEEALAAGVYALLAIGQTLVSGRPNLDDHFFTPLYFALPVVIGHARGASRGATSAMLGGWTVSVLALAFGDPRGSAQAGQFPLQHVVLVIMLGLTGAGAGLRSIPRSIKPLLTVAWVLMAAAYHPEYLRSVGAFVTQMQAIAIASIGLYLNPLRPLGVQSVYYPTSPSRRD